MNVKTLEIVSTRNLPTELTVPTNVTVTSAVVCSPHHYEDFITYSSRTSHEHAAASYSHTFLPLFSFTLHSCSSESEIL